MLTKEQIAEELRMAYAELRVKEDMQNYADSDFIESISYEIKALESKIAALINRYKKASFSDKKEASNFWTNFMFEITGIKKDTAVGKHNSI